jgi:hypothetical protein
LSSSPFLQDLPDEIKKKVLKAKVIEEDFENPDNFDVLCHVLRFTTKRAIIRKGGEQPRPPKTDTSESNLPVDMLLAARK